MQFVIFNIGDRVRMSDHAVKTLGGPRLSGVVDGYGSWHEHRGFLRIRHDETGEKILYAPYFWQRESDGAIGKGPNAADLARIAKGFPIETEYGGYRMRSRLEARWAVFFDALGVAWEYEKEGYEMSSGRYLPDFWLPQVSMFAEVKPTVFSTREQEKCFDLATHTGNPCLLLDGTPTCKMYMVAMPRESEIVQEMRGCILTNNRGCITVQGKFWYCDDFELFHDTYNAVAAARSARFEYGESGSPELVDQKN